jgi:hypothetical protein
MANDASEAGEAVDKASQRMQVSAEDYQKLAHAADLSGVSMQTMETAAKSLQKSGSDLDFTSALKQVAGMKNESERTAKALELFGARAGYQLAPLLNEGTEGITAMMTEAEKLGLVMSDEAVNASAKFNDSLGTLQSTFGAVKNRISSEMLPGITSLMDGLTGMLTGDESAGKKLEQGAQDIVAAIDSMMPQITDILTGVVQVLAEVAPEMLVSLVEGLMDNMPQITDAAVSIIQTLSEGLSENAGKTVESVMEAVSTIVSALLSEESVQSIISAAVDVIITLAEGLSDNVDMLLDGVVTIITTLVDELTKDDNMQKLIDAALDIVLKLGFGLVEAIPKILGNVGTLSKAIADALKNYDWASVGSEIAGKVDIEHMAKKPGSSTHISEGGVVHGGGGVSFGDSEVDIEKEKTIAEMARNRAKESAEQLERLKEQMKKLQEEGDKARKKEEKELKEQTKIIKEENDKALDAIKENLDEQKYQKQKTLDKNLDATKKAYDKEEAALDKSLDNEMKAFEAASDARLALIDKEYTDRLKLIDEEEYKKIKALDAQIDGINSLTAAEEAEIEKREQAEKLAELQARIYAAETDEDRQDAERELAAYQEDVRRKAILADRAAEIEKLENQKDAIKAKAEAEAEAVKAEAEAKKAALKAEIDAAKEALQEKQRFAMDALKELHDAELERIKEVNEADLREFEKAVKKKLKILKESGLEDGDVSGIDIDGSHAGGLRRVPYNGYLAELHEGERVLTRTEARTYSEGGSMSAAEARAIRDEIRALRADIAGGINANINNTRDFQRTVRAIG